MNEFDVIVIGGGPAGIGAALAAAESGASVLLAEAMGELGGSGGPGCVNHWLGGRTYDGRRFVAGGLFRRLTELAVSEGIAKLPLPPEDGSYSPHGWGRSTSLTAGIPFDGVLMAEFLERQCLKSGVKLAYFTNFIDCRAEKGRITSIRLHDRGGFHELHPAFVIDASGDAAVAAAAGAPCRIGRDTDHLTAPATLEFQLSDVDGAALKKYIDEHDAFRFLTEIRELRERGIWNYPYDRLITVQLNEPDVFMVNTSRLTGIDGLSGESLTEAMIRGRRETLQLVDILRKHFPGFAKARLKRIASFPGIRETRRICGSFTLTTRDLLNRNPVPDVIGFSLYPWDLPDPVRPSFQPMTEKKVPSPGPVPLPFGIMEPMGFTNLLCPGRAVSIERDVLGPVRVMAPCMVMGEAAGTAAATGLRGEKLRACLRQKNCVVDNEFFA